MVRIAHMRSQGPWYPRKVMATGVLIARGVQRREIGWSEGEGAMTPKSAADLPKGPKARTGNGVPTPRQIRTWAKRHPDLPERLVRDGLAQPADFPAVCRKYLRP